MPFLAMFDNLSADIKRFHRSGEFSLRSLMAGLLSQGFQAILVYRFFNWLYRNGIPSQPLRFVCERFIEMTTGISIPACCRIGKGLRIHHFGGIIFHPTVELGDNCTVYHGVTIGDRGGTGGAAKIGRNVLIGAGAKIIGKVTIGDNCLVGANAVVTVNLPTGHVASCGPCQIRPMAPARLASLLQDQDRSTFPRIMDVRGTYKGGGGPDKTILNSAAEHDKSKVSVLVTYLRQPGDNEFQIPHMAAQRQLNYAELVDGGVLDLRCLWGLRRLIREHRINVVHTRDDKTLLYGFFLKWMTSGVRFLHTCHSHSNYQRSDFNSVLAWWKFCLRKHFLIFLMKRHHPPVLTVSENTRRRLIQGGLAPQGVRALPNGIDLANWTSRDAEPVLRKELALSETDYLVGTVARITYDKDLPAFYKVVKLVTERLPRTRFVIVGDGYGDELNQARTDVERLGLSERVHFTGHRNDLKNVYASLDLFLMTSRTEGMPNTMLEAMALELPVVSTAVGGVPELVIDGVTGILCPRGDAQRLAEAVCQLLMDEELRLKYGRSARRRVEERFDFATRVRAMEDIYAWFAGTMKSPPAVLSETRI